jgi:hypothetical protein
MPFPKVEDWPDEVYNAGTRGAFNLLRDLEKVLHKAIPDLREYNLGIIAEDDIKNVAPMGWVHMKEEHFDYADFNQAVGLRYGLQVDASGNIKAGECFIMMMPKNYRKRVLAERSRAREAQEATAHNSAAYVHPSDPNAASMREGALEMVNKDSTSYKVQAKGNPDHGTPPPEKSGPGRPKKE